MLRKNEAIPKILENFLNYLIAVRGYSINTVKAYRSDLMQFFVFTQKYKEIVIPVSNFNIFVLLQIKESDIIAFLTYLNFNQNNNPYTRQRKLSAIRRFFKWLLSTYPTGNERKNPASNLPSIKKVERIPKHLTLEQAQKIQNVFNLKNTRFHVRNNTIICLFLSTGIRLSELININIENINFDNNTIIIFGKNNKERLVYFNKICKDKMMEYLDLRCRTENALKDGSPLFINKYGKRISVDGVENICNKAYKLMKLEGAGYTTHTLRHTSASIIYTYVNEDILLLQHFLGHSRLTTTQIYTHVSNTHVKEAVERNPLNTYEKILNAEKVAG